MGNLFLKAFLIVLALLLYGTAPRSGILIVFAAIILWRIWPFRHGLTTPLLADQQEALYHYYLEQLQHESEEELTRLRGDLQLHAEADAAQIAVALIASEADQIETLACQEKLELKLLPFSLILFPAAVTLAVSDIVVMDDRDDWRALLVIGSALAIHLGTLRLAKLAYALAAKTTLAIAIMATISLPILVVAKHPYLNPLAENRSQLIADHVLKLKNNVVAESHVEFVLGYALELKNAGNFKQALNYYNAGLHLDAENQEAHLAIAEVLRALRQFNQARFHEAAAASIIQGSRTVAFSAGESNISLPAISDITTDSYTVVLVPVGNANRKVIAQAGALVNKSLKHPVYLNTETLELPAADRKRGLLVAPQHSTYSIHSSFVKNPPFKHDGPVQVVLITDADVYMEDTNFVFAMSSSSDHVCVVSYNRFQSPDPQTTVSRLAKQILSSSIKAMRVPQANTLDCVTAYVNSRDQFDRKSINLLPQTRYTYELHIKEFEKAKRAVSF
jgi:predicted Zn-dependent protease